MALDHLTNLYKNAAQEMVMHRDVHAPLQLDAKGREALQRVVSHRRRPTQYRGFAYFRWTEGCEVDSAQENEQLDGL